MHALITVDNKEMRLLDDVRLVESDILAPPIVSTFERSSTIAGGKVENNRLAWHDSLQNGGQESALSQWNVTVLNIAPLVWLAI